MKKLDLKSCGQDIPLLLLKGIEQFNRGEFYECHDTIEELWMEEAEKIRDLYKGILQIGVALYHERHGNRKGALRLLTSGIGLIEPFAPACLGIDVSGLMDAASRVKAHLEGLEPSQRLAPQLIPHIEFIQK
jgi:uncharacterized protein